MSNSLVIDVPNVVKQNTPLRNVPSGSTSSPDYSVKYVPQDLTEEQQAQARENIGAAKVGEGGQQIQSDWNQTNTSAVDYIKNKPTIPAAQIQSDWNQTNTAAVDYIKNKPTIPAAQVQSDWNQTDASALDYIKNKPTIPSGGNDKNYFWAQPSTALTITSTDFTSTPAFNVEYSFDKETWQVLGNTSQTLTLNTTDKVYLRAITNRWSSLGNATPHLRIDGAVSIGGNLNSLLFGERFEGRELSDANTSAFAFLFAYSNTLQQSSDLVITTTSAPADAYHALFIGCTNMTRTFDHIFCCPTDNENAYSQMFGGCTSLTNAPVVFMKDFKYYGYQQMFDGCTSIREFKITATGGLINNAGSYNWIFHNCTNTSDVVLKVAKGKSSDWQAQDGVLANSSITNWTIVEE